MSQRKGETREEFNARMRVYMREYTARDPEKWRTYGRTWARKESGIIDPPTDLREGPCEICGDIGKLNCDHDHSTGLVRGWLCHRCNMGLGYFKDDAERVLAAGSYLRKA